MRFAVLEHRTAGGVHWDLLVEQPGQEGLASWRLLADPLTAGDAIPAERIADHRPIYLKFEGELSGGRGRVRRVDDGRAGWLARDAGRVVLLLEGRRLRGRYQIAPPTGAGQFAPGE